MAGNGKGTEDHQSSKYNDFSDCFGIIFIFD